MLIETRRALAPRIHADDISWHTADGFLEVSIAMMNASAEPTEAADLVIETAPLGAFVPFEPGTRVAVAGFEPWERRRVAARIPMSGLRGVMRLLAIQAQLEIERLEKVGGLGHEERIAELQRSLEAFQDAEWAGNLNVYFDSAPADAVEVHRALDLKVEAGRSVAFLFVLPSQVGYGCEALPSDSEWKAKVMWSLGPMLFVSSPASVGTRATVEVRVTREADGRMIPVVFSFETVAGRGDTLGCVRV